MLCTIYHGNVPTYSEGQQPVVHLVSKAQTVHAGGLPFVFTNGHGIMTITDFYDDLSRLDQIDWKVMSSKYWNDTVDDPDRKRRRQAEFLIHNFCPWAVISEIGVMTVHMKTRVEAAMAAATHKPVVTVHQEWYY
jgi:hypothetical protein